MATQKEVGKALVEQAPEQTTLAKLIKQSAKELGQALPAHLNPERLVRIALTSIRLNPKLAQCTPESFLGSLFVLAQIGIEPIAGRAYLLPFRNNKKLIINGKEEWRSFLEVQAIIGYKGLIELFYRHEAALSIEMQTVHKNDEFDYEYGTNSFIRHKPALGDRGEVIGYYAIAKMKGGGCVFRFMSKEECIEHGKKHSKTFDKKTGDFFPESPWKKDLDAMCKKTVLIQLAKVLPLSVELQRAIAIDETSREYRKGIDNALDLPDTTSWEEPPVEEIQEQPAVLLPEKDPPVASSLPKNVLDTIVNLEKKIGKEKFYEILGSLGYSKVEEIPDINEANKLIREVSKVYAEK